VNNLIGNVVAVVLLVVLLLCWLVVEVTTCVLNVPLALVAWWRRGKGNSE
jgi:hypothetical protein